MGGLREPAPCRFTLYWVRTGRAFDSGANFLELLERGKQKNPPGGRVGLCEFGFCYTLWVTPLGVMHLWRSSTSAGSVLVFTQRIREHALSALAPFSRSRNR